MISLLISLVQTLQILCAELLLKRKGYWPGITEKHDQIWPAVPGGHQDQSLACQGRSTSSLLPLSPPSYFCSHTTISLFFGFKLVFEVFEEDKVKWEWRGRLSDRERYQGLRHCKFCFNLSWFIRMLAWINQLDWVWALNWPVAYQPHISHISATYQPNISQISATYQPYISHTYQPNISQISAKYQPHISHIPSTYQPHISHIWFRCLNWQGMSFNWAAWLVCYPPPSSIENILII